MRCTRASASARVVPAQHQRPNIRHPQAYFTDQELANAPMLFWYVVGVRSHDGGSGGVHGRSSQRNNHTPGAIFGSDGSRNSPVATTTAPSLVVAIPIWGARYGITPEVTNSAHASSPQVVRTNPSGVAHTNRRRPSAPNAPSKGTWAPGGLSNTTLDSTTEHSTPSHAATVMSPPASDSASYNNNNRPSRPAAGDRNMDSGPGAVPLSIVWGSPTDKQSTSSHATTLTSVIPDDGMALCNATGGPSESNPPTARPTRRNSSHRYEPQLG